MTEFDVNRLGVCPAPPAGDPSKGAGPDARGSPAGRMETVADQELASSRRPLTSEGGKSRRATVSQVTCGRWHRTRKCGCRSRSALARVSRVHSVQWAKGILRSTRTHLAAAGSRVLPEPGNIMTWTQVVDRCVTDKTDPATVGSVNGNMFPRFACL